MPGQRVVQGERRVVTILFCDVKDSTAMAEQLDPEEWAEIMNEAFKYLTDPVHRYGGTVARLMGDGILAFFGAPEAHEDDPQRAVLSGLTILKEIDPFCNEIKREYGLEFNVRVGIHTGNVIVGEIGTNQAMEYTAMGDAVNVASRMESTAQPGTVQISEHTQKLIAPFFDIEALGEIEVKGKSGAVPVFQVLATRDKPGSLRGIEGLHSPLVGRTEEAALLKTALEDLNHNRGGIVNIIGDAGLGKSRLILEAQEFWTKELHHETWTESRGISYDSTRPYSLFIDFIHASFDIDPTDDPSTVRSKISYCLDDWSSEQRELVARAIELLLAVHEDDNVQQDAEALQREFTAGIQSAWKESALREPSVVVFDDLHWADPTSINILAQLFSLTDEVPILFICAMRPYRRSSGWGIKNIGETEYPHRYTEIELKPLTDDDSDTLIGNLLTVSELPIELRRLILKKAEGNPFFVEEVIRTLIDEGALQRDETGLHWETKKKIEDISLPDNLQALIIARIDRLDSDIRRTLQLASVIGRSFFYRILEMLDETTDELNRHLAALQRVDLIHEAARMPELEYMFLHEMTRDAAYETILRRERRKYHRGVGEAIEGLFPDRIEDEAPRLARHFLEAGELEKAFNYYVTAGDHAARLYANTEAIGAYSIALELQEKIEVSEEQIINLYTRRGRMYELTNQYDEALESYEELGNLGRERGSKALQLAALLPAGTIHSTPTAKADSERGRALSDQALAYARELSDPLGESKALWNLMLLEGMINNKNQEAVVYGEMSLQIARQHDLREQLAYTLHDLTRRYLAIGDHKQAIASAEEARELWRELDNKTMLGNNYTMTAYVYHILGEFDKAIELATEGLRISQSIGSNWGQGFSHFFLAEFYLEKGDFGAGIQAIDLGLPKGRQAQLSDKYLGFVQCLLGWAYCMLGDYENGYKAAIEAMEQLPLLSQAVLVRFYSHVGRSEEALALLNKIIENFADVRKYPLPTNTALTLTILGEPGIALGKHDLIRELVDEVRDTLHALNSNLYLADLLYLDALILMKKGHFEDAARKLIRAEDIARQIGSRRALLSILPKLVEVENELGNEAKAQEARSRAIEVIDYIADHAGSEELRQTFLDTSKVKAVLL